MPLTVDSHSWKSILALEIAEFLRSDKRREMLCGERYYQGKHDILKREKSIVGPGGRSEPCPHLLNSRVVDNQYARVVDQKVGYFLGKPCMIETDKRHFLPHLSALFGAQFRRTLRLVGEDAFNCGLGWLHPCYDRRGALRFRRFAPWEIHPLWADDAHSELEGALRVFHRQRGDGYPAELAVEFFTPEGMYRFLLEDGALREQNGFSPYFSCQCDGKKLDGVWPAIPLVPFRSGFREIPLIRRVKGLQDGINTMLSDFQDRMGEDTHHTVLVIRNYDGEDLGEFRRNLATFGAVKVRSDGGGDGGVEALSVEVDASNFEAILAALKRALLENAKGFDSRDLALAASPNQMAIQSMYADMDLDAGIIEVEFSAAFQELMAFVAAHLERAGMPGLAPGDVEILFNRDVLINETESIDNCLKSAELLSRETLLYQHPWTADAEKELQRLEAEAGGPT